MLNFAIFLLSGLDSLSSTYCVQLLHNLAREGRTIICTIHQPSAAIYDVFDQVYVMAEGQCVYRGAPANTLSYLGANGLHCPIYHSVADFRKFCLLIKAKQLQISISIPFSYSVVEVANGDYGPVIEQLAIACQSSNNNYEKDPALGLISNVELGKRRPTIELTTMALANQPLLNDDKDGTEDGRCSYRVPSEWSKFCTLVGRCRVHYFRDWVRDSNSTMVDIFTQWILYANFSIQTVTHLKLLLHILCATLIGLLYGNSGSNANKAIENVGFFMVGVAYLWYTTVMPGVLKCM